MKNRYLVVAPQPFFTPRGTPFSVYHRLAISAELGVECDLLTYAEGTNVDVASVNTVRVPRLPWLGEVKVGPSFGKLVRDVFMVAWTLALLVRRRYTVVHAHEEAVFWCSLFQPLFRFRLIYDMHSSLPQQLTNFEFTSSKLLIGVFRWLEDRALRRADAVITISPSLASYAVSRMPDPSRHVLIENSILDPVRLRGGPTAAPSTEVDLPDGRIALYAGTLEAYQGIDLLLDAFAHVRTSVPDARLVIVGGDPAQVAEYRAHAKKIGVAEHCDFLGKLDQETTRALMRRADVLTSPRTTGTNTPLKVYELLASGVPFVATRIPSHTQVLDEEVCFLADPDPEGFASQLEAALTQMDERNRRVASARELYEREYARPAYVDKVLRVLSLVEWPRGDEIR